MACADGWPSLAPVGSAGWSRPPRPRSPLRCHRSRASPASALGRATTSPAPIGVDPLVVGAGGRGAARRRDRGLGRQLRPTARVRRCGPPRLRGHPYPGPHRHRQGRSPCSPRSVPSSSCGSCSPGALIVTKRFRHLVVALATFVVERLARADLPRRAASPRRRRSPDRRDRLPVPVVADDGLRDHRVRDAVRAGPGRPGTEAGDDRGVDRGDPGGALPALPRGATTRRTSPTRPLLSWVLSETLFRWFVPDESFPVSYRAWRQRRAPRPRRAPEPRR